MKIGARILKTGIAIILALFLAQLLELPSPSFAGIAAIFAIQPTIFRSYRTVIEQIQGNIVGAAVAIIFLLVFGNHVFIVGLACIIVIIINVKMNTQNTITLAVVTVIAIMESENGIDFAFLRFFSVLLGIFSSFVVNLLFIPPKYETKLYRQVSDVAQDITKWIRISTRHAHDHSHIKSEIQSFKEQVIQIEQLYLMYKEDKELFKKATHAKARKLVVYRKMIATTKRSLDILKKLNKYENHYYMMPSEFQAAVQEQLDYLVTLHEHIHLKYIRKTKTTMGSEIGQGIEHRKLLDLFLSLQKQLDGEHEDYLYHMMALISAIIEYEEHIVHLDTLITSFHSFHQDDELTVIDQER
ncbi:MAG: aromatic acid exporter family protein [Bacillus sp. (in: firmicutes)]